MKKIFTIFITVLLIFTCSTFIFACSNDDNSHEHTFNMSYSKDKTHHWFSATCEHESEVLGKAEHDYNLDFICQTCGYKHNHEYSSVYSKNETSHWYETTCGHSEFKKDLTKHVYDGNYICLLCEYSHEHSTGSDGKCECGFNVNEPETTVTDLVGKSFYLQSAIINEGDGDKVYSSADVGYSKDFYNITFTENGKGYANIAMPIDKEITYEVVNGEITLLVYRDTIANDNSQYVYRQEKMKYTGSFKGNRLVLNYSFVKNGVTCNHSYIFAPGEKLTNEFIDYTDFVGKTYTSKIEGEKYNYREISFKENNLADVTFYNYTDGEPIPTKHVDCISILTSEKVVDTQNNVTTYYYVLKTKCKGNDYNIKFTIDGVVVGFKEVV